MKLSLRPRRTVNLQLFRINAKGETTAVLRADDSVARDMIAATMDLYARRGYVEPWTGYLAVRAGILVGTCGFAGPPINGEVELAYFTFPGHEGGGIATAMASQLLSLCADHADAGAIAFIAHTLPEEDASTSVLRKLGFRCQGAIAHPEDGTVWKWGRR